RHRDDGVAHDLAEQRHPVRRNVERAIGGNREVEQRHDDEDRDAEHRQDHPPARPIEAPADSARHASCARPLRANMPCGRFCMKTMMKTSTAILASTAPCQASSSLLAKPSPSAAYTVPANCPTPPRTTTMNESTM